MAFENDVVWEKVLSACELDAFARDASVGLQGFPLEHIFQVNPSLNYVKLAISYLTDFYDAIRQYYYIQSSSKLSPKFSLVVNFVEFTEKAGILITLPNYDWNNPIWDTANAYLNNQIESDYYKKFGKAMLALKSIAGLASEDRAWITRLKNAEEYYHDSNLDILTTLANGVYLKNDAPNHIVEAWVKLFDLFLELDNWNGAFYKESLKDRSEQV